MSFAEYMKNIRKQNDITQLEIANILDISTTAIKLIEKGNTKFPSEKVLHNLSVYLHISEYDVATDILFPTLSKDNIIYATIRYIVYKYLEGWNVDSQPIIFKLEDMPEVPFAAKMTKRREPTNCIIIDSFAVNKIAEKEKLAKFEAISFISYIFAVIFSVQETFRGFHLIFDSNSSNQTKLFNIFKSLELNKIPFDFQFILFDPINCIIVDKRTLK